MSPRATRVVLADDDVLLHEGLASLLERSGYEVVGRCGSAAALLARASWAPTSCCWTSRSARREGSTSPERHDPAGGAGDGVVADHTLWWPPGKVAGRRLAPFLAAVDDAAVVEGLPESRGLPVQMDLEREFLFPIG